MQTKSHWHLGSMGMALVSLPALMALGDTRDPAPPQGACKPSCDPGEVCEGGKCVPAVAELSLFFTDDEHGYVEESLSADGTTILGGVANLMSLLRADGHDPEGGDTLLVSAGDNWDGSLLSWYFDGAPMIAVMNLMGYTASAMGNHELTKGPELLEERRELTDFPYLAANLYRAGTGEPPRFVAPYVIRRVNGVAVGIVGLILRELANYPHPWRYRDLAVESYASALASAAAMARADGAELLVGVAHACQSQLELLASDAASLGFVALVGGHCSPQAHARVSGVEVFTPGAYLRSYARLDIEYDRVLDQATTRVAFVANVRPASAPPPDEPEIEAVIADYRAVLDDILAEPVGFTGAGIAHGWPWNNAIADAWLASSTADIAIGDWGSVPGAIPPGAFDRGRVYESMPFNNELLLVTLTGAEIIHNVTCCGPAVLGGVTARWLDDGWQVALADGTPVQPDATYRVITHDFWISRVAVLPWQEKVAAATWPGVDWREPVIDYLVALASSPASPLDTHLDPAPRITGR